MKRKLALILALTMALLMALSSISVAGGDADGYAFVDETTGTKIKHYGDVRLKLLNVWNGSGENISKVDWINNPVATKIRETIGVTVEVEGIMMNEIEKLNLLFASGDMPDLIDAAYWASPSGENAIIKKAALEGMLLPIDDYFDEFPDLLRAYQPGVLTQKYLDVDVLDPAFGGKHYVLPAETPGNANNITRWSYGLGVRGDIPALVGIDETSVHTADDLYKFLKAVKEKGIKDINGNDVIPLSTRHNGWALDMTLVEFTYHDGPYITSFRLDENGKTTTYVNTPKYLESVLYVRKLVSEGLLDKECFTQSAAQADTKGANGQVAVGAAMFSNFVEAQKKSTILQSNPEMLFVPLGPMHYGNGQPYEQVQLNGNNGAHVWIFPITNQNLEATLAWIAYINSYEGQILTRYGFEGVQFEYNEDGKPRRLASVTESLLDPERKEATEDWLRQQGVSQYSLRYADMSMDWFGEKDPGGAAGKDPDIEVFFEKDFRPLRLVDGYPIDGLLATFPRIEEYSSLMAGDRERTAREKAYFASSDEEATAIIEEYREYLRTAENGVQQALFEYIDEMRPTREDWIY